MTLIYTAGLIKETDCEVMPLKERLQWREREEEQGLSGSPLTPTWPSLFSVKVTSAGPESLLPAS